MLVICVEWHWGIFYDSYEKIIPHVISTSVKARQILHPLSNNDFGLLQIYMLIQRQLPAIDVFSCGKVFFTALAIAALLFASFLHVSNWPRRIILLSSIIILAFESILIMGNVRISMLMSCAAFMILALPDKYPPLRQLILFYCLVMLAVLNRIEIALLASFIGLAIHFTFQAKHSVKHSLVACSIGLLALFVFHAYNFTFHRFVYSFISTERALADQQNSTLRLANPNGGLFPVDASTEELVDFATAFFVLDEPVVNVERVEKLIHSPSLLHSIFNNPEFIHHFLRKVSFLFTLLVTEYLFLVIGISVLLVFSFWQLIAKGRATHIILLFIGLFVLPFTLSIIAEVPEGFLTVYLSCMLIGLSVNTNKQEPLAKIKLVVLNAVVIISSLGSLVNCTFPRYEALINTDNAAIKLRFAHLDNSLTDSPLFGLTYMDDALFRTRLFTVPDFVNIDYLSFGPFDQANVSRASMKTLYGENYASLAYRIRYVADQQGILACSDETFKFFSTYSDSLYGLKLDTFVVTQVAHERIKLLKLGYRRDSCQ